MTNQKPAATILLQQNYPSLKILQAPKKKVLQKLAVTLNDEIRFIAFDDILYCMSTNNYTTIFLRSGISHLCCKTLKGIESKLPTDAFVRIHHSYLVNIHCITALKRQSSELELDNKLLLPISRTQKTALYELLGL